MKYLPKIDLSGFHGQLRCPDVQLTYDPVVFFREARLPFADTDIGQTTANCVAGPAVVDSANRVGEFHTNTSPIIP